MCAFSFSFFQPLASNVAGLEDKDVISVAAGASSVEAAPHFLALTSDGSVYSWGNGDHGKLGTWGTRGE